MSNTINFYSPQEEREILRIYSSNEGLSRGKALSDYAKSINRSPGSLYQKALLLTGKSKKKSKIAAVVNHNPAKIATVKSNVVRLPYRDIQLDMVNKELVISL